MVVRELLTRLGFEVDNKGAEKYESALDGLIEKAKHLAEVWGVFELGKKMIESASDEEQLQLQFEQLLGSAEKAHAYLEQLADFSIKNPMFEKDELAGYAKQMLSLGYSIDEINPLMTQMTNIAAVMGADKLPMMVQSLDKVRATGRVTIREVNSLMLAGIPIVDQMAKQAGVTKRQMMDMLRGGSLSADQYYKALAALTTGNGQFAGGLAKQANTIKSIYGGIATRFKELGESIGLKVLPVLEAMGRGFINFYDRNRDTIESVIITPAKTAAFVLGFLIGAIGGLLDKMGGLGAISKTLKTAWESFWHGIEVIVANKTFDTIAISIGAIAAAWKLWNLAMDTSPIGKLILALTALITLIGYLHDHWDEIVKSEQELQDKVVKSGGGGQLNMTPELKLSQGSVDTKKRNELMDLVKSGKYRLKFGVVIPQSMDDLAPVAGHAIGSTFVPQTGLAMLHAGEAVVPRGQLASLMFAGRNAGSAAVSKMLSVQATIQVSVPEGTPASQASYLKTVARQAAKESFEQILRQTDANLVPVLRG